MQKHIFARRFIATLVITLTLLGTSVLGLHAFAKAASPSVDTSTPKLTFKNECGQAPKKGYARCLALGSTTTIKAPAHESSHAIQPQAASPGQGSPYSPAALHAAYHLPSTAATVQTVAVVDAYDDPSAESDLAAYRSNFGLPACTTANGCFRKVDQNGGTNYPTADSGWSAEISLDLDMVSAICTNCHILLVEGNNANSDDLGTSVNTAVSLGANEVSNSYGSTEYSGDTSLCDQYYNHPNVAITAGSGDSGPGVSEPGSCANVVSVGGTTLHSDGSETAWSGSGGGCSAFTPHPSWENSSVTGCANRATADVSAVADPNTGVSVYNNGGWYQFGGTSASTPIIAAVYALAGGVSGNAPSVPWTNYTKGCLFAVGGNTYNYQTGLGSPNGLGCFGGSGTSYRIVNRNSGKVLDISGLSTSNGGAAIQWPYNGGANQQWKEVPFNGGYKLVNRNSGLLLDDPGYSTTNGTQLDQWADTTSSNQWWNLTSAGGGYYYLVNQSSGLYADVSGGSTADGASVIEWPYNGGTNQQWQLIAV